MAEVDGEMRSATPGLKKVVIHSDGGCQGNPGPGGWAATLAYGPHKKELSGGEPATTNNRMELKAAIEALSVLKESCEVEFYTDSEYVKKGHAGHEGNERCDQLATEAMAKIKKTFSPDQLKAALIQFKSESEESQSDEVLF